MDARAVTTGSPRLAVGVARGPRLALLRRAALALVTAALATLALAAPASATTETFNFTGAAQTWTVPAGVTSATFDLYGAQGGGVLDVPAFAPGLGGRATATIAVNPGDTIQVNVGGQGLEPAGGFNGGGVGATGAFGGGGASDIRVGGAALTDRVLVAGGGGGAAGFACFGAVFGGDGGGDSGDPGNASTTDSLCAGSVAGGGGTLTDGGSATSPATEGESGFGGDGFNQGGGGGGGWFGGGGGFTAGGGGGGSGFCPFDICAAFETGVREGNGLVTVTYTVPTATIADLIVSVEALDLHGGIENGLLKKLTNAQRNLDAGNTANACSQLASFINQVGAQSGKKIDAADATDLIEEAEAVRASIGCG
jgi:hypothetical protein